MKNHAVFKRSTSRVIFFRFFVRFGRQLYHTFLLNVWKVGHFNTPTGHARFKVYTHYKVYIWGWFLRFPHLKGFSNHFPYVLVAKWQRPKVQRVVIFWIWSPSIKRKASLSKRMPWPFYKMELKAEAVFLYGIHGTGMVYLPAYIYHVLPLKKRPFGKYII